MDVRILVDNAIDILNAPSEVAQRPPWHRDWIDREQLRAEHGYSLLVTVTFGDRKTTILYDAGLGRDTAIHNLDVLGQGLQDVQTVVLSHGHADHHNGLEGIFRRVTRRGMPLVLHPDAWRERKVVFPNGTEILMPPPSHQDLDREGWQVVEERGPSLLLDNTILVTGQVERVTDFEKGFPLQWTRSGDDWERDTWIWDDQGVVLNLRDRGLIVLSSCSHAGSVNVIRHAQQLTGITPLYAFVGGMHLTGGLYDAVIPLTVQAIQAKAPRYVVPGHCTGWRATHEIVRAMPEAYLQSNVGTLLHFAAPVCDRFVGTGRTPSP